MFLREKQINGYTYLYLVESVREDGRAKQRIIKRDRLEAGGGMNRVMTLAGGRDEMAGSA